MSTRPRTPAPRRPYTRPEVQSERFAERHAMACPKHLDPNTPKHGCISGVGYNS